MPEVVHLSVTSCSDRLRQLVQSDVIDDWLTCGDCAIADLPVQTFTRIEPNEKRYLVWEKGRIGRWFYQEFVLPETLQGYPLQGLTARLALTWWAELAEVYVNGEKVQEGDLFDHSCRIVLSSQVVPGEIVTVAIRLVSPGHDIGGLMRSRLIYESDYTELDPGFVADELEIIQSYIDAVELDPIEIELEWNVGDRVQFNQALERLRNSLLPFSLQIKQHTIFLLGHAHLDMAWLWDVEETWRAAKRTFTSVLNLQKEFPELTFCHTTPALYEWIEQNEPEIFAQIQAQVKAGKWEIVGGMWVEPEMNLINAESIMRHLLYGQRYCQEKFGQISRVAWLPDTFGFNWQTPQFLKQAGIDYFVTQKLRWNDTTQFPYDWFDWQAPDGSKVRSLMSSPIGESIDPIKMANYTWEWSKKTRQLNPLWLFGVGDHGGGPTRDMLKIAERWKRSPFFPNLEFTTALNYLEILEAPKEVWNDELYLEFHRGCYTTHGDQKEANRRCEGLLKEVELWASLATITTKTPYPKLEIEKAWKGVLFNQFHDILPGSSIKKVFDDTGEVWTSVWQSCMKLIWEAKKAIAQKIEVPEPPHPQALLVVVFNALNWSCSEFINVSGLENEQYWKVFDLAGQPIEKQNYFRWERRTVITFLAEDIPTIGYRCFWLCPIEIAPPVLPILQESLLLENEFLRVTVNSKTGDLDSIFDKQNQREILSAPGNQLQAFVDQGQYWDAWNIDPEYAKHPLPSPQLIGIKVGQSAFDLDQAQSAFRSQVVVERQIGESVFEQTYKLEQNSPVLEIKTHVYWQERHVLVKAAFPLNLEADFATYEIAGGAIDRTTKPQTEAEKAKWEVSALGWIDLSNENYGVSLLSDCKHGYDCQPDQIRLTLLRGSEFPDPDADRGNHSFTYQICPHSGDWKAAQTVHKAYELNQRSNPLLQILQSVTLTRISKGTLPPVASLLDLQADHLILSSLKQSEDNPSECILRCYECHGEPAELNFRSDIGLTLGEPVNLLERSIPGDRQIQPWQIRTYKLRGHFATPPE